MKGGLRSFVFFVALCNVHALAESEGAQAALTSSFSSTPITVSRSSSAFSEATTSLLSTSSGVLTGSASSQTVNTVTSQLSSSLSGVASTSVLSSSSNASASAILFPAPSDTPLPPLYPSTDPLKPPGTPNSPGLDPSKIVIPDFNPAWDRALERAAQQIKGLTLEEKVNFTTGVGFGSRCVGNIPRVRDWPGLCLEDSPLGVRLVDFVTSFPAAINAAATFNRKLIRQRGLFMGVEHVGKGVHVALGPMMNTMRIPAAGRNWEGFGGDPYLNGEAAYETILGMQGGGVQACAKHYIDNEQEHKRTTSDSLVDERTQHEVYAHPFLRSVQAGVASVMCSYNQVNGTYACENDHTLNHILKGEFGFRGYVVSDWGATHSTLSAVAGLDMTMPGGVDFIADSGHSFFGGNLTAYVQNGTIPENRVDNMATRILAAYYLLHQDSPSFPPVSFNSANPEDEATNDHIDVQGLSDTRQQKNAHAALVRDMGRASTVLLKNNRQGGRWGGGARGLPLTSETSSKLRSLVMVGSDASPGIIGPNHFRDQTGTDGVLAMGWGSGTSNFTHLVSPFEAIQRRSREDRTSVSWMFDDANRARAGNMAIHRGAALVFIQSDSGEGEGGDRANLTAMHDGDLLVQAVAAQNNNTIVVVHSVGPVVMEPWVEHPNVTAIIWAGLPGQEAGDSLVDVLWGDYNPSGRLPFTIAKQEADYSAQLTLGGGAQDIIAVPYTEGLLVDYKWFDARNITPRFEFGFGLSYTQFKYSSLSISKLSSDAHDDRDAELEATWSRGESNPPSEGSSAALWLHRPFIRVQFGVKNTGSLAGTEIAQLYLHMPSSSGEPPSVLRGFTDVQLDPGSSKEVVLSLSRYDLSVWDIKAEGWRKPQGTFEVSVGASSRNLALRKAVPL